MIAISGAVAIAATIVMATLIIWNFGGNLALAALALAFIAIATVVILVVMS